MFKNFKVPMFSLRIRIFLSMIILIIVASLLLLSISIIQYKSVAKEYNQKRVESKEYFLKKHINYMLSNTTYPLTSENRDCQSSTGPDGSDPLVSVHHRRVHAVTQEKSRPQYRSGARCPGPSPCTSPADQRRKDTHDRENVEYPSFPFTINRVPDIGNTSLVLINPSFSHLFLFSSSSNASGTLETESSF